MMCIRLAAVFATGIAVSAIAQPSPTGGFMLTSTNVVTPSNPITTIGLWAWFD